MKKYLFTIIVCLALGAASVWLFIPKVPGTTAPAEAAKPEVNPLQYTPAQRKAAGIELAAPEPTDFQPQIVTYGRVIDPSPVLTNAADVASALAGTNLAQKEFTRLKALYENGGNATLQAMQAAESAVATSQIQLNSTRTRFAITWGRNLANRASEAWLESITQKGWTLARLDFFPGQLRGKPPEKISVKPVSSESAPIEMEVLGQSNTVDPQVQGTGLLLAVEGEMLPIGLALQATIAAAGEPKKVLFVTRSAVVYHQGSAFVYTLGYKDTFERHLVTLGQFVGEKVVITDGIEDSDQVVVKGAQQLLSGELQAASGGE